jgi:hypothetical protein
LAPAEHPTTQDICWVAGVFEGEGSVAPPSKHAGSLVVSITQKDKWLLERLRALFGGSVLTNHTKYGRWNLSGARGRGFVMTIYKFLSPRRQEQIRRALGIETQSNLEEKEN